MPDLQPDQPTAGKDIRDLKIEFTNAIMKAHQIFSTLADSATMTIVDQQRQIEELKKPK